MVGGRIYYVGLYVVLSVVLGVELVRSTSTGRGNVMSKPQNFVLPPPNAPILGNDIHAQFALPPSFWTCQCKTPRIQWWMRRGAITDTNFQYEFPNQLFATQTKCVVGSFQAACKISCHASVQICYIFLSRYYKNLLFYLFIFFSNVSF